MTQQPVRVSLVMVTVRLPSDVSNQVKIYFSNLFIALRVVMTCPILVASAERSFSTSKLIKTFRRSTIMDDSRLSSLALLSVENACVRSLDYNGIIDAFATAKARKTNFKIYKNIIDVTTAAYKDRIFNLEWQ